MDHGVLGPVGQRGTVALGSPSHLVLAKDGLRDPGAEPEFTSHGDTEPTEQILKPTPSPYTVLILERGVLGLGGERISYRGSGGFLYSFITHN